MDKLFIKIDDKNLNSNIAFYTFCIEEIETVSRRFYDKCDYIKDADLDCWFELPITEKNLRAVTALAEYMAKYLKNKKR